MNEKKELIEFEEALYKLIKSKLLSVKQEQVKEHFGSVTLQEYIKLVVWDTNAV